MCTRFLSTLVYDLRTCSTDLLFNTAPDTKLTSSLCLACHGLLTSKLSGSARSASWFCLADSCLALPQSNNQCTQLLPLLFLIFLTCACFLQDYWTSSIMFCTVLHRTMMNEVYIQEILRWLNKINTLELQNNSLLTLKFFMAEVYPLLVLKNKCFLKYIHMDIALVLFAIVVQWTMDNSLRQGKSIR